MRKQKLNFGKLEVLDIKSLKTIKGGAYKSVPVTLNTISLPENKDDGDDGIKND